MEISYFMTTSGMKCCPLRETFTLGRHLYLEQKSYRLESYNSIKHADRLALGIALGIDLNLKSLSVLINSYLLSSFKRIWKKPVNITSVLIIGSLNLDENANLSLSRSRKHYSFLWTIANIAFLTKLSHPLLYSMLQSNQSWILLRLCRCFSVIFNLCIIKKYRVDLPFYFMRLIFSQQFQFMH